MSSALRWGLGHRRDIILRVVYDTLLLRSDTCILRADEGAAARTTASQSAGLLMSLRKQSIEQYLQCFLSVESHSSPEALRSERRSGTSFRAQDVSFSPSCVFRSIFQVANLFALCITLGNGSGAVQANLLRTLSHLIDGNPLNAEMIHSTNLTLNLSRFLFSHNNAYPRTSICHILSQLFSYKVTPVVFTSLVGAASAVAGGLSGERRPMPLIPSKGVSQRIGVETDLDDLGCQILYMLGRAAEHPEAQAYAHFDQSCPFLSRVVLPAISSPPARQVGMTAFMWLRLGNLSDAPNATVLQLSMDHPLRHDSSAAHACSEDGDRERDRDSSSTLHSSMSMAHSIDFYFRVVHQTGMSRQPGSSSGSRAPVVRSGTESSLHPPDASSVASGPGPGAAAVEEVQRSYVQLCASYGESVSVPAKRKGRKTSRESAAENDQEDTTALGLDGEYYLHC
jgi:hypothetical protein